MGVKMEETRRLFCQQPLSSSGQFTRMIILLRLYV